MGYWTSYTGWRGFFRRYLSIIITVVVLSAAVGALTGYAGRKLSITGGFAAIGVGEQMSLSTCLDNLEILKTNVTTCWGNKGTLERLHDECVYNMEMLSETISDLQDKLSTHELTSSQLEEELLSYKEQIKDQSAKIEQLTSNLTSCESDVEILETQVDTLTEDIINLENDLTDLQDKYNTIVANAAKNICCTQKIYNPALKYYYVKDNIIKCTTEASEELGTKEFSCF